MTSLSDIFGHPFIAAAFWLIIGSIITHIFIKVRNKTGVLGYVTSFNRLALSADDSVFGSVRATWQGYDVRNLHIFAIELENLSTIDYDNVEITIYSDQDTQLLNEQTELIDTPYTIPWSTAYTERMTPPNENSLTQEQIDEHFQKREYCIPTLNRFQKARFSYLCTRPRDDENPQIFISTPTKGVRLKRLKNPSITINPIWGVPIPAAIARAFVIALAVVLLCGLLLDNVWIASAISMFVGLSGQLFGAISYRCERYLRNLIAG